MSHVVRREFRGFKVNEEENITPGRDERRLKTRLRVLEST